MPESLLWWLAVEVIGLAAFPIAFAIFRFLPDRGYAFAKSLGLILVAYVFWLGGLSHLVPNARGSVILIIVLLAVTSAAVGWRSRDELRRFVREQERYIVLTEVLFAAAFAAAAFLHSYTPDIGYGEKPMNFAFLNALLRADSFPPEDPWLSGHSLAYYYLGHLNIAVLTKLTGVTPGIAYNLGAVTLAALAVLNVFALVYNLIAGGGRIGRAVLFGLVGVVLLAVMTNLDGFFELLAAHGIGSTSFYNHIDIDSLDGARSTSAWYPTEPYWWWRVTRIATAWDHREMPFVSLLAGDIHPHVNALPFVLLTMAIALNLLRSTEELSIRFWQRRPLWLLPAAAVLGSLAFLNPWDLPTFLFLVIAAVFVRNYLAQGGLGQEAIVDTATFAAPLALLTVVMYLPAIDYAFLRFLPGAHPVGEGIHPLEVARRSFPPVENIATRPHHFLYIWGPMLAVAAFFVATSLELPKRLRPAALWALAPGLAPLALWALLIVARRGPVGFGDELATRSASWITALMLVLLLAVAVLAFARHLRAREGDKSTLFALGAVGTGLLLILGSEFFWAQDPSGFRSNTVFRLGYQAWILLAVGGAYGLYRATVSWPARVVRQEALWSLGATAMTLVLLGGLVYPVTVTFYRTNDFANDRSLDGLVLVRAFSRDEYDAALWLRDNVDGTPVVLEAVGDPYSSAGRISARTGLPTVLGWPDHEYRWRGSWEPQAGRREDVEQAYETTSAEEARAILEKYDVEYVYVGDLERDAYGEAGMAKFAELGEIVFQQGRVTIYRVGTTQEEAGVRQP